MSAALAERHEITSPEEVHEQPAHDHYLFVEPSFPNVNFDKLKVDIDLVQEEYIDQRNPFVVLMELGKPWIAQARELGYEVTAEELVQMTQYRCGISLGEPALKNLRGLARDTITPPTIPEPYKFRPLPGNADVGATKVEKHQDGNGQVEYFVHKEKQVIRIGEQVLGELQISRTTQESEKE